MAKSFLTSIQLNGNSLLNGRVDARWSATPSGTTNPDGTGTAVAGQISSYAGALYVYSGSAWTALSTGAGTVTSVTGTSPVVSSGGTTPAISLAANYGDTLNPYAAKTANYVLAAPNGSSAAPTFRALVAADIPTLNQNTTGSAATATTAANLSTTYGSAPQLLIQSGTNTTTLVATGTLGQPLVQGPSGPTFGNLGTLTFGTGLTAGGASYNGSTNVTITPVSATTSVAGIVQLSDSTSTTSSVLAATATAAKAAYDRGSTGVTDAATAQTTANAALPKAGGTMSGAIAMGNSKITGLGTPTSDTDAATKAYVDSAAQGIDWKASVHAATTANGTLATAYANGSVIDGVTLVTGDRILIKDQTTGSENGIYTVNASGAPTRATDCDTAAELTASFAVFVEEGTANADSGYVLTNDGAITVGTTALVFTQFTGLGQITAGNGLTKTANTLNVVGTADRITVGGDSVDIASTYAGQSTITTLGTVTTGTWNGTVIAGLYGGTGVANSGKTITLGGNLTTSGAHATTLTTTGTTTVTLPTSGTLLTTAGSGSSLTFGTGTLSLAGNLTTSGSFTTTLTATANTSVTLPTSGTLVNSAVTTLSSLVSVGTITTGVWDATDIAVAHGGTGASTAAGARTNLGATTKVTAAGSGSGTSIAVAHGLGTAVIAQLLDSTGAVVEVDVVTTATASGTTTFTFSSTQTLSNFTYVIIG